MTTPEQQTDHPNGDFKITITRSAGADGAVLIMIDDLPDEEELRVLCGDIPIAATIDYGQNSDTDEPREPGHVTLTIPLAAIAYPPKQSAAPAGSDDVGHPTGGAGPMA